MIYLNPSIGKREFLRKFSEPCNTIYDGMNSELCRKEFSEIRTEGEWPLFLVHNGTFDALGIINTLGELNAATFRDGRAKHFWTISEDRLLAACGDVIDISVLDYLKC